MLHDYESELPVALEMIFENYPEINEKGVAGMNAARVALSDAYGGPDSSSLEDWVEAAVRELVRDNWI